MVDAVGLQLRIEAASDHLGDRDAQPGGTPTGKPMLRLLKLYLKSNHDGITIPS
jgi:hypothetical protein